MIGPTRLEIDADEGHVVVARAFVAGALRALGAPDRDVTAARLAVSELVTAFVHEGSGRVVVTVPASDRVEVIDDQAPRPGPLAMQVASSVAGIDAMPGGWRIRLGGE